ncbi:carotenoid isomerooxygenase [Eurytemora carolleeae]|uniref:carotenoid isomerooxygenase n=1 Tax=Eurytemora carolleeae TaxID=1294199 RepID=UPI000C781DE7|nr:carotenoid isomerooxygenase [Eurytemora carolleeae]|eukprot:XP_023330191.1 carotenoid isomerooxygenase-like [Eurytemora affinis]
MIRILLFSHLFVVWAQENSHSETPRKPQNVKGWASYFENEISSFLDVPLEWALNTEVPHWLLGSYIKNGPGKSVFEDGRYYENWLDGSGKIHKLTFANGTARFSGRMLETGNYNKSVARKAMVPSVTLDRVRPTDWSIYELFEGALNGYDNTNVLLWKLGPPEKEKGMYIATTDYPLVHEIDPNTLRVKQAIPFTDIASMASC